MTIDDYKTENEKLLRVIKYISKENERLQIQLKVSTGNVNKLINILNEITEDN